MASPAAWELARAKVLSNSNLSQQQKETLQTSSVESVADDIERLESQHATGSKTRRVLDKLQPLLKGAENFTSALDIFATADPYGILGLVWGGVRIILSIASKYAEFFEKMTVFTDQIASNLTRLQRYEDIARDNRVTHALCAVFENFLEFAISIDRFFSSSNMQDLLKRPSFIALKSAFWVNGSKGISGLADKINAGCIDVEKEARVALDEYYARQHSKAEAFHDEQRRHLQNQLFQDLEQSLSPIDVHKVLLKREQNRQPGTCEWILSHSDVKKWIDTTVSVSSASLLWTTGKPGCGKSYLAAFLATKFLQKAPTGYFLCDANDPTTQTLTNILKTILWQLICQKEGALKDIATIYQSGRAESSASRSEKALAELLRRLASEGGSFIVIDALDECPLDEQHDFLRSIQQWAVGTKVLLISRRQSPLTETIPKLKGFSFYSHIEINRSNTQDDILSFVGAKSTDVVQNFSFPDEAKKEVVVNEITHVLISNADGMFLWPRLMADNLIRETSLNGVRRALKDPPHGLKEMYDRIYGRYAQMSDAQVELAFRTFTWILHAQVPMTVEEVLTAVATVPGSREFDRDNLASKEVLMAVCSPLVEIDAQSQILRIVHASAIRYLSERHTSMPSSNPSAGGGIWKQLGAVCLTSLCDKSLHPIRVVNETGSTRDLSDPNSTSKPSHRSKISDFLRQNPFYVHAILHLPRYLEKAGGDMRTSFLQDMDIEHNLRINQASVVLWLQIFHYLSRSEVGRLLTAESEILLRQTIVPILSRLLERPRDAARNASDHWHPSRAVDLAAKLSPFFDTSATWETLFSYEAENYEAQDPGTSDLDFWKNIPIHIASFCGLQYCVQEEIDAGVSANFEDCYGIMPLHLAILADDPDSVGYLLSRGASPIHISTRSSRSKISPFIYSLRVKFDGCGLGGFSAGLSNLAHLFDFPDSYASFRVIREVVKVSLPPEDEVYDTARESKACHSACWASSFRSVDSKPSTSRVKPCEDPTPGAQMNPSAMDVGRLGALEMLEIIFRHLDLSQHHSFLSFFVFGLVIVCDMLNVHPHLLPRAFHIMDLVFDTGFELGDNETFYIIRYIMEYSSTNQASSKGLMKWLLDHAVRARASPQRLDRLINFARDYETVLLLTQGGADPNHRNSEGRTLLHDWASEPIYSANDLKGILDLGVFDPRIIDDYGVSPHMLAKERYDKWMQETGLKYIIDESPAIRSLPVMIQRGVEKIMSQGLDDLASWSGIIESIKVETEEESNLSVEDIRAQLLKETRSRASWESQVLTDASLWLSKNSRTSIQRVNMLEKLGEYSPAEQQAAMESVLLKYLEENGGTLENWERKMRLLRKAELEWENHKSQVRLDP